MQNQSGSHQRIYYKKQFRSRNGVDHIYVSRWQELLGMWQEAGVRMLLIDMFLSPLNRMLFHQSGPTPLMNFPRSRPVKIRTCEQRSQITALYVHEACCAVLSVRLQLWFTNANDAWDEWWRRWVCELQWGRSASRMTMIECEFKISAFIHESACVALCRRTRSPHDLLCLLLLAVSSLHHKSQQLIQKILK